MFSEHIEENLGLDEQKLNESSDIFSLIAECSHFLKSIQGVVIAAVLLIAVILGCVFAYQNNMRSDLPCKTENDIVELVANISKKFIPQQKDIWLQIITGFTNLIQPPISPAVYLLLSDEPSMKTSSCVAEIITLVANK